MAKKRSKAQLLWPTLAILLLGYSLMHLFSGERGLLTWNRLKQQVNELEAENEVLKREIHRLERQAQRLNPDNPDLDYVDETLRRQGPWVKKKEEVFLLPNTQK